MNFFGNIAYASVDSFVANANRLIINPLIILLFALALAYFLWGVFEFISNADNEEKRTEGKSHMIYGVIGLTVMLGVWTILQIVLTTLDIKGVDPQKGTVTLPDYSPPIRQLNSE